MADIKLDVVTAEQVVYSDEVDTVIAPGVEGQLGILPHHAPLMTILEPGELWIRKEDTELCLAISGGFLEVRPDRVIVLADAAERSEEIDQARAEEAMRRAQQRIKGHVPGVDVARAEAALRRAIIRVEVAQKRGRRSRRPET
jgi:F-type H+-transporting ATPase subunit epsilon